MADAAPKAPKKEAPRAKKAGPSVSKLIVKAIAASKEKKGVSLATLKKALAADGYDVEKNKARVKVAVRGLATNGTLTQTKGTAASGSLKLSKKQAKKPAAKKPADAKKPKKAAAKKPATAKKPAVPKKATKSPKKARKSASPKKAAKSPKKTWKGLGNTIVKLKKEEVVEKRLGKGCAKREEEPALESESDDGASDVSSDSDEEVPFEFRLDPMEDVSDDDGKKISPSAAKKGARPQAKQQFSWQSENDEDISPPPLRFCPAREPGAQLRAEDNHTPLDLFKLFFSKDAVDSICRNTNKQAARSVGKGAKYRWVDVGVSEFYTFLGLVFYMGLVKLKQINDYWRKNSIFTVPFPAQAMTRDRFRTIFWNVHMSDPDQDKLNDAKRGTSDHDELFRVKPLMSAIQAACKAFYHPRKNLTVDERVVASKFGFRLFVLADSSNGYTSDFSVYAGKKDLPEGRGLSYDSVMSLVDRGYLGCGYHVYTGDFFTSPKLFKDLHAAKFGACGAYRESRKDCPRSDLNALTEQSPRGTIRWVREGPVVYVRWMDTQQVSVCSTIHAAYTGDAVQRRVRNDKGAWLKLPVPCPKPVVEYNKHISGVELSDQLIQYFTAQHKTVKWYKKLLLHFLDIAATNAFILHKELMQSIHKGSMTHKQFMEELIAQLCGVPLTFHPPKPPGQTTSKAHLPICCVEFGADGKRAADGRQHCEFCRRKGTKTKTVWKCEACNIRLCLQQGRNCFTAWHQSA